MTHTLRVLQVGIAGGLIASTTLMGCMAPPEAGDRAPAEGWTAPVVTARTFSGETAPPAPGGEAVGEAAEALNTGHGINYNGGPVMSGTVNVYYVWYGNWAGNSATSILPDLAAGLGGSQYWGTNSLYDDNFGGVVANALHYGGSTTDAYSQGTNLSLQQVWNVVSSAISQGRLPNDANGIYLVLSSADVAQTNGTTAFCTNYCGWHTYATAFSNNIKFGFIGNGDRCPASCRPASTGPNGNAGADGMASVIAHELAEAVTDPLLNAWYDAAGNENADKCAWTFGNVYTAPNGAQANVRLGARDFRLQQNWVNYGSGYCALSNYVLSPYYRYYNATSGDHFYTTSFSELGSGGGGYVLENIQAHPATVQGPGMVPFHRFRKGGLHFYSTNQAEGLNAGYIYEGVSAYVNTSQVAGTVPLYRYVRLNATNAHFYTTSFGELGGGTSAWKYEGVAAYVYP